MLRDNPLCVFLRGRQRLLEELRTRIGEHDQRKAGVGGVRLSCDDLPSFERGELASDTGSGYPQAIGKLTRRMRP